MTYHDGRRVVSLWSRIIDHKRDHKHDPLIDPARDERDLTAVRTSGSATAAAVTPPPAIDHVRSRSSLGSPRWLE
eukprot:7379845-Prymnesium_polylepis.1